MAGVAGLGIERAIPDASVWPDRTIARTGDAAALAQRTAALKPLLRSRAQSAEALRRPDDEAWAAIRQTGIFHAFVPRKYGGLELDPRHFVDIALPLSEACPSTGWVAAFCVEHNWLLANFPQEAQDETFGRQSYVIAPAVTVPPGRATPVKGGFRLSGHWRWGTGVVHADWVIASALIEGAAGAAPDMAMFLMPAADVEVPDTWSMDGMAATGSHDIVVRDLFVPAHRMVRSAPMRGGRGPASEFYDSPLYRIPMAPFLAATAAISAVGAANATVELTRERLGGHTKMGSDARQSDKPASQLRLGRASTMARTAELLIRDAFAAALGLGDLQGEAQLAGRIATRAQIAYAVGLCRQAILLLCEAGGSSVHRLDNPLQRMLRDVNVISTHIVFDEDVAFELRGRDMLGLPPNSLLV